MSGSVKYLLISLPADVTGSSDRDEAFGALQAAVSSDYGTTSPFHIPTFKIGTLDALVQQADELGKLCSDCENVVTKVGESLSSILDGDQDKIAQQKNVNDRMTFCAPSRPFNLLTRSRTCASVSADFCLEQGQISDR